MPTPQTPEFWDKARRALSRKDPVLRKIIANYTGEFLATKSDAFYTLARAIIGQQISVKAADKLWERLHTRYPNLPLEELANAEIEYLRTHGLSSQKATYLRGLAHFFHENPNIEKQWQTLSDEEVITALTALKGIGRWTAEMFLIFYMLRPDIFPIADLGLLKAIEKHYGISIKDRSSILELAENWRPWRSVATWYLWRSLDPVSVEY